MAKFIKVADFRINPDAVEWVRESDLGGCTLRFRSGKEQYFEQVGTDDMSHALESSSPIEIDKDGKLSKKLATYNGL